MTTICPVDLPMMLSDSAGKGVLITAVAHGTSQLKERWGEHGGQNGLGYLRDQDPARRHL